MTTENLKFCALLIPLATLLRRRGMSGARGRLIGVSVYSAFGSGKPPEGECPREELWCQVSCRSCSNYQNCWRALSLSCLPAHVFWVWAGLLILESQWQCRTLPLYTMLSYFPGEKTRAKQGLTAWLHPRTWPETEYRKDCLIKKDSINLMVFMGFGCIFLF